VLQIVAVILMMAGSSCTALEDQAPFQSGKKVGQIGSAQLTEISGVVASRRNPGVLWVHNDSGDGPRIYAVNVRGELLVAVTVSGAQARDWEDIAAGPGPEPGIPYLYVGDIGDNAGRYPTVTIYRVKEPQVDPNSRQGQSRTEPAEAITLVYADGPRDAETLLVDPLTRDLYVISKREICSRVYRASYPQSTSQTGRLELVCLLPWGFATGGDVSPDGTRVAVRSMFWASMWNRDPAKPLWQAFRGKALALPLAAESQGEAIGFDLQGLGYYTISEGKNPVIYYFEPDSARRRP
jgi:hypothetical protein